MSHRHCCYRQERPVVAPVAGTNFLLPLAALIGLILVAFGRCKGTIYAVLVILAVLIVCGCGARHRC